MNFSCIWNMLRLLLLFLLFIHVKPICGISCKDEDNTDIDWYEINKNVKLIYNLLFQLLLQFTIYKLLSIDNNENISLF